jgi:hypothetical protein
MVEALYLATLNLEVYKHAIEIPQSYLSTSLRLVC